MSTQPSQKVININEPRYDQSTYLGRVKHFSETTSISNILASNAQLENSKEIVESYRRTKRLPPGVDEEQLWKAKYLMESAYHPDTKEKMFFLGRMSALVPINLVIGAGMLTWYKSTSGTIFWQVINQSALSIVNYTNRSGDSKISTNRLIISFMLATSSATATALFFKSLTSKMPPIFSRFVPFIAVAAANCVNMPFMRSNELVNGIQLMDKNGNKLNNRQSTSAAKIAIAQVVLSRILTAAPPLVFPPIVMNYLEKRYPLIKQSLPLTIACQLVLIASFFVISIPLCCAIFPQKSSVRVGRLEKEVKSKLIKDGYKTVDFVYYNKGL